jgi:hypothetical protein
VNAGTLWVRKERAVGPDFSNVDIKRARALSQEGTLAPLFLLPAEFGGTDVAENVVFVPLWVVEQKRRIDMEIVAALVRDGHATRYAATPEYQGSSAVPIALQIRAYDPKDFRSEIAIWGDALARRPGPSST